MSKDPEDPEWRNEDDEDWIEEALIDEGEDPVPRGDDDNDASRGLNEEGDDPVPR